MLDLTTLTAAAETLVSRADAVVITDAAGNRFRKVFAGDLDRLAASVGITPDGRIEAAE